MESKNQGEGDYEAAERYDERTRKFVEQKQKAGEPLEGSAEDAQDQLTDAEREALRHAKRGDQDRRDAEALRRMESEGGGTHPSEHPGKPTGQRDTPTERRDTPSERH